ncbi:MAG: lipopolysaccharide biosynthesis protein [Sedimentisphaerales bacterium]|nr:lipopolysaccharide biosynthesis protein [Sedimentisphaerales bacterium]
MFTLAGQTGGQVIQIASTMVLARVLAPRDFGWIAMIYSVSGLLALGKDLGLSVAAVQRDRLTSRQASTLFWLCLAASLVVALLTAGLAPAIAWFYGQPQLVWLAIGLAGAYPLGGLGTIHQALLRRQMRFRPLAVIQVGQLSFGAAAAVISAFCGAGVWSLVVMAWAANAGSAVLSWLLCRWRPGRPGPIRQVRQMLSFGGHYTGQSLMNYLLRNVDNVLIGRFWGSGPLALYSKAYGLLLLPIHQINAPLLAAAIPTLSRLQTDPPRFRRYFLQALGGIALVTLPLVLFMVLMAEEVIGLVLGDQWVEAGRIFAVLGLSAFWQPLLNAAAWLYVACGRADRMFRWSLCATTVHIMGFVIGLAWGPLGVATAYTISIYVLALPSIWYACRATPVGLRDIFGRLWRPLAATALTGLVLGYVRWLGGDLWRTVGGVLVMFAATGAIYLAILCLLAGGFAPLREWKTLLAGAVHRRAER